MRRRGLALLPLWLAGALALGSCSGRTSALDPRSPEAGSLANLWWVMFGLATAVYVVVATLIVVATFRGRRRAVSGSRLSDGGFVWVGGIIVPAIILMALGVLTVTTSDAIHEPTGTGDPLVIEVTGTEWWWDARYPEEGFRTANELHVPTGRPVEIHLTSDDVIHSFWVPELAGKLDAVPGQTNVLRFRAERAGRYLGVCAEFCGIQHANMGFAVVAQPPGEFGRWVARQRRPASPPTSELAVRGQAVFLREACAGCHTIRGTEAKGRRGPDLTHVASRQTIGARVTLLSERSLARWIDDPDSLKPGVLMPGQLLRRDERRAVVEYLLGLE